MGIIITWYWTYWWGLYHAGWILGCFPQSSFLFFCRSNHSGVVEYSQQLLTGVFKNEAHSARMVENFETDIMIQSNKCMNTYICMYIYICTYIHVCMRYHLNLHGYVFAPSKQLESAEDHADALAVMGTLLRPRAIWMPSERISENTATSTLHNWLVVFSHPSEKYESQLGWWNSQYDWENKIDVPNHQPDSVSYCIIMHQVYS